MILITCEISSIVFEQEIIVAENPCMYLYITTFKSTSPSCYRSSPCSLDTHSWFEKILRECDVTHKRYFICIIN